MDPKDFEAYRVGICYASVCSKLTLEEATARLNMAHPTGIGDWQPSDDETFRDGQPNPCPCNKYPATHKHYLFVC